MAVSFDAVGPSSSGFGQASGTTPFSWTHVVGAGTDNAILVWINIDGVAHTTTVTCTFAGTTMTPLTGAVQASGTDQGYVRLFGLAGVATGSGTVQGTISGGGTLDVTGGSLSFTSVSQTTPFGTPATSASTGGGVTISSTTSGNLCAGVMAAGNTITATGSPSTSRFVNNLEGGSGGETGNIAGATSPSTGSAVTMGWTTGSTSYVVVAVEVLADVTVTSGPPLYPKFMQRSPGAIISSSGWRGANHSR